MFLMTDVLMYVCTDGWMDGCVDGCVDGCRRIPNTNEQAYDSNNAGFGYGLRLGTGLAYCMACTGLVSIMSRVGGPCAFRLISVAILAQVCSCFAPDS